MQFLVHRKDSSQVKKLLATLFLVGIFTGCSETKTVVRRDGICIERRIARIFALPIDQQEEITPNCPSGE